MTTIDTARGSESVSGESRWVRSLPFIQRVLLFTVSFLLPIWFLPWGGIDVSRSALFGGIIFLAAALWVIEVLFTGRVAYVASPVTAVVFAVAALVGVSAFLSQAPLIGLFSSGSAETFVAVASYAVLYFLCMSALRGRKDSALCVLLLMAGASVAALVSFVGFFGVYLPFSFAQSSDFTVMGSMNAAAFFYGAMALVTAGFLVGTRKRERMFPRALRIWAWVALILFLVDVSIINYANVWGALLLGFLLLSWVHMRDRAYGGEDARESVRDRYFYLLLSCIIISLLFLFIRVPLFSSVHISSEVSPSFSATVDIAKHVLAGGTTRLLFGMGPGTFPYAYSMFHDPSINATQFWSIRFGGGFSFLSTSLATVGVAGVAAYIALIFVFMASTARRVLLQVARTDPFFGGVSAAVVFLFIGWFLFAGNGALLLLLFLLLGASGVTGVLNKEPNEESAGVRRVMLQTPWALFASSLAGIFVVLFFAFAVYAEGARYAAAVYAGNGADAIGTRGDVHGGIADFERAASLDRSNDSYQRFIAQARLLNIKQIISQAAQPNPPSSLTDDFQKEVTAAVTALQSAVALNPLESLNFETAGAVYETLVAFVPGADQSAVTAYSHAIDRDPSDPALYTELGRAYMVIADAAEALANQKGTPSDTAKQYRSVHDTSLTRAEGALQKAISLKSDLASAHFIMAQVLIREGAVDKAIASTESAKTASPRDIGILFQLGLLYYQDQQYTNAKGAFEQAISVNPNYSNARYFLGLILDRQKDRAGALEQFEYIANVNPDNQEVQKIISNIKNKKPALTGIAPPAPENRSTPPIKEGGSGKGLQKK